MFLGLTNFYRRFIINFNRITASLTLMLRTTNKSTENKTQNTQAENQNTSSATSKVDGGGVGGNIKNLSTIANLANSKKSKSKVNFAKANSETDFLSYTIPIKDFY